MWVVAHKTPTTQGAIVSIPRSTPKPSFSCGKHSHCFGDWAPDDQLSAHTHSSSCARGAVNPFHHDGRPPTPRYTKGYPREQFERSSTEHTQEDMWCMCKFKMHRKALELRSHRAIASEKPSVRLTFHTDTVGGGERYHT